MVVLKYIIRCLLMWCVGVGIMGNCRYQSYCQQNFKFLFRDKGTETLWIGLNLYGDQCESSKAIQVNTSTQSVVISDFDLAGFDAWEELNPKKERSQLDYAVELESTTRAWEYPLVQLKLRNPVYNAKLMNYYLEELNAVCGQAWNNAMGVNGTVLPRLTALKTPTLIYAYPTGLYFNYEIDRAYYFPDSQYLLVFTRQSTKCLGGGSMHGFLLFKFQ